MIMPDETQTQSPGPAPRERETPCPELSRFWDVALDGAWSSGERQHVTSCPKCRETERKIGSAVGGRVVAERDLEPLGSDEGSVSAVGDSFGSANERTLELDASEALGGVEYTIDQTGSSDLSTRERSDMPRRLGEYEFIETLGCGGMGTVYKVRDVALGRVVALKMIRRFHGSNGPAMDRFFRSARISARLDHPAIVPIYTVGQFEGVPYVVSKLIEGTNLGSVIAQTGAIPAGRAARIAGEIADALHHAHGLGVIHRDVKPSNIMIDPDDHAILTDFGLARSLVDDDEASVSSEGQILGTPSYMSPEQARGQVDAIGPTVDVYSLGATLYALLTGKGPFSGRSTIETIRLLLDSDPPLPSRLNPMVHRDLEAICLKAMNKRPDDRYASAHEMAEDLQRFLDGRPTMARSPGAAERLARWLRRSPARFVAIVAVFATFALFASQQLELRRARHGSGAESRRELRRIINRPNEADLRSAIELGETRIRNHADSRESRRALAAHYHRLGDLLINTDRLVDAPWAYERAVTLLRQVLRGEATEVTSQIELADVLGSLGEASWALGRASDAREAYRQAMIVRQSVVTSHSRVTAYRDELERTLNRLNELTDEAAPEWTDGP